MTKVESEVEVDLELLLNDLPEIACEHSDHEELIGLWHSDGPASYYIEIMCPNACGKHKVMAICTDWMKYITDPNTFVLCTNCWNRYRAVEGSWIIGTIKRDS